MNKIQLIRVDIFKNLNGIDGSYYSGETINLDFHTIPHFGDNPPLDNHWSGSRNKALKSAYTFIAQDAESRMTSYINADIKKGEESQEILHFVEYAFFQCHTPIQKPPFNKLPLFYLYLTW